MWQIRKNNIVRSCWTMIYFTRFLFLIYLMRKNLFVNQEYTGCLLKSYVIPSTSGQLQLGMWCLVIVIVYALHNEIITAAPGKKLSLVFVSLKWYKIRGNRWILKLKLAFYLVRNDVLYVKIAFLEVLKLKF